MPARTPSSFWRAAAALVFCAAQAHASAPRAPVAPPRPAPPAPRRLEPEAVLARIKNVVVGGVEQAGAAAKEQARVVRSVNDPGAERPVVAAEAGLDLYSKDEVVTGPDANVTIVFVPDPEEQEQKPDEYREIVLDQNTQIMISNPERNTVRLLWGRFVGSVWGYFNSSAGSGSAAVRNTEFELCYPTCSPPPPPAPNPGGEGKLTVIEGVVVYGQGGHVEQTWGQLQEALAAPSLPPWDFKLAAGQAVDARAVIRVKNPCQDSYVFFLKPPETLAWLTIPENFLATLKPGEERNFLVKLRLDAKNVQPDRYEGKVGIECAGCETDAGCQNPVASQPVAVEVMPAREVAVDELQELDFKAAGPLPTPSPAAPERLLGAVELESRVYVATQLSRAQDVARPGDIQVFQSLDEMRKAYVQARLDTVTKTDRKQRAAAYEVLGDVYRSVGEGEKAVKAYRKVLDYDPDKQNSYQFMYKRSEAYRRIGQFDKAEGLLDNIFTSAGVRDNARTLALAHVSYCAAEYGRAERELKAGSAAALGAASRASWWCDRALTSGDPKLKSALSGRELAVLLATQALAQHTLGTYYLDQNQLGSADASYRKALELLERAKAADKSYPLVREQTSLAYTGLANVEKLKAGGFNKATKDYYSRAEKQLGNTRRSGDARSREASVVLEMSRGAAQAGAERAPSRLTVGEASGDVEVPDLRGKLKDVAVEILAKAGLNPKLEYAAEDARRSPVLYVTTQTPPGDRKARRGSTVTLRLNTSRP